MSAITFRPLEHWPGEQTEERRRSSFGTVKETEHRWGDGRTSTWKQRQQGATWSKTIGLIERELAHLAKPGTTAVVQLDLTESQFRLDGRPRADARPKTPRVIVSLESEWGPLSYPCDTFDSWLDNLYAIASALEALRKVDRYGVTKRGEQYTGWRALPPEGGSSSTMTAEAAADFMSRACDGACTAAALLTSRSNIRPAYLHASRKLHPDAGGSAQAFQQLGAAKAVLEKHHGGAA